MQKTLTNLADYMEAHGVPQYVQTAFGPGGASLEEWSVYHDFFNHCRGLCALYEVRPTLPAPLAAKLDDIFGNPSLQQMAQALLAEVRTATEPRVMVAAIAEQQELNAALAGVWGIIADIDLREHGQWP